VLFFRLKGGRAIRINLRVVVVVGVVVVGRIGTTSAIVSGMASVAVAGTRAQSAESSEMAMLVMHMREMRAVAVAVVVADVVRAVASLVWRMRGLESIVVAAGEIVVEALGHIVDEIVVLIDVAAEARALHQAAVLVRGVEAVVAPWRVLGVLRIVTQLL
jgi:hypothetical protein